MAFLHIVGAADCPYFARAERLAEILRLSLQLSKNQVTIEMKSANDWDAHLHKLEIEFGFQSFVNAVYAGKAKGRVVVYNPTCNRLIGSEQDFTKLMKDKYNVVVDLGWGQLQAIARENAVMFERQQIYKKNKPLKIVLTGPPLSGKKTQALFLAKKYDMPVIFTYDIIKEQAAQKTPLGKRIAECVEKKKHIADEDITPLVLKKLKSEDCVKRGWILEGFPITENQATSLRNNDIYPDLVVTLQVLQDTMHARMENRRVDPVTNEVHYLDSMDKSDGEAKEVLQRLIKMPEDTEENVRARNIKFHASIGAVVTHCFPDVIAKADGNKSKFQTHAEISAHVEKLRA